MRPIVSRLLAACLFATPMLVMADDLGVCSVPIAAEKTAAIDMPDYSVETDPDLPDPAQEQRERAGKAYQRAIVDMLKSSADPRDWAMLGAGFYLTDKSEHERSEIRTFLERAAKTDPADAQLQWLVLAGTRQLNSPALASQIIDRLEADEPDNGAVWVEALARAATNHDRAGVSTALERLAMSSTVNNHFSDTIKLIAETYARIPPPDELIHSPDNVAGESKAYVYSLAIASAFVFPAYQPLTTTCLWDETGRNAAHAPDCERAGRLMSQQSDTLLTRAIGFAVLRASHTFNDDDVKNARNQDWVSENFVKLAMSGDAHAAEIEQYHLDWVETGNEVDAMRRRIERMDIAPTPPDDWIETNSRFSQQRIEQDTKGAAERLAHADY